MPDLSGQSQSLVAWLQDHALALLFWGVVLLLIYRLARPIVHRVLLRIVRPPAEVGTIGIDGRLEVEKRVATLEDLFAKIIRFAVVVAIFVTVLAVFDAWSVITGLGLLAAALTLAGQDIVLDYLTGILLLAEGPYFKGDVVILNGIEGTVEEVGLRRTIVRDGRGTVHSIANGLVRVASNETRMFATSVVDVVGIAVADVEGVIAAMNRVGAELAGDPAWSPMLLETPKYLSTVAFAPTGLTIRMAGRVRSEDRGLVDAELRRRLAAALADAGIRPNQLVLAADLLRVPPAEPARDRQPVS
jgi:moderate conductance mechanosensitive channel